MKPIESVGELMKQKQSRWFALILLPLGGLGLGALYSYRHFQSVGGGEGAALSMIALGPYYLQCTLIGAFAGLLVGVVAFVVMSKEGSE